MSNRVFLLAWLPLFLFPCRVEAFPPAPYYTLFGMVRDQTGQVIRADGAQVLLLKGTEVVGRATIESGPKLDQNYSLAVRIDHSRPATLLYNRAAVASSGQFSLAVEMNGQRYLPIEVSGSLTAGKGSEFVRLDLTLGEDSDRDGLPDAWEQWQLYQAGYFPGENGWDISLLDRNGDFDKDGQSNWMEYLAGTFAGDAAERFVLDIKEWRPGEVKLEFFGITGKTYSVESSVDLKTWTKVPLKAGNAATAAETFTASQVGVVQAEVAVPQGQPKAQYRLTVR
jgi:hypothetical protein